MTTDKMASNPLADMFASSAFFGKKKTYTNVAEPATTAAEAASEEAPQEVKPETPTNAKNDKQKKKKQKKQQQTTEAPLAGEVVAATDANETENQEEQQAQPTEPSTAANNDSKKTNESKERPHDPEKSARTVFVGNVSLEATVKEIKKFFSSCGAVESVRLRSLPVTGCAVNDHGNQKLVLKVCAQKKLFVEDRDNCNAYVTFAANESVEKALKLNGSTFKSKTIRVDRENLVIDPKRSVFVGNLPLNVTEDKVWKFFTKKLKSDDEKNAVENVRIIRDRTTGVGKGFGYVLFKSVALAAKALALHEAKFENRELRVLVCGKRFKNRKGEDKNQYEGLRASSGAKARIQLKRKAQAERTGPSSSSAKKQKTSDKPKKPKHAARKAAQLAQAALDAKKKLKKKKTT